MSDCVRGRREELSRYLKLAPLTKLGRLTTDMYGPTRHLTASLQDRVRSALDGQDRPPSRVYNAMFECLTCQGFMLQPVCLPCGHSLCKACLGRPSLLDQVIHCQECKKTFPRNPVGTDKDRMPTVVLQNSFVKWFPEWVESCRHREEGNTFAQEGDFPIAVQCYSKALATDVSDQRVLGNRSRAYLAMGELDSALVDAVECCRMRPFWAKGYYRKAAVLDCQGKWKEAVVSYLLCVELGGKDKTVETAICKLLDKHVVEGLEAAILDGIVQQCCQELNASGAQEVEMTIPRDSLQESDFECSLCTSFLFIPVTTACGHSFCQACLSRSFDHSPFCPVCRMPLAEAFNQYCSNGVNEDVTLARILKRFFSSAFTEREASVNAEALISSRGGTCEMQELPIFVCTMAYPGMACPLHIFEPRYRLMLRRSMENGSRRFGMCHPAEQQEGFGFSFSDYGTVLYISSLEYTPDGRSLLTTMGERRFKVLSRDMCDGYHTARISFLNDELPSTPEEIAALQTLQKEVYEHAKQWFNALSYLSQLVLMQTVCSPLPPIESTPEICPNGPKWVWWFVHGIPTSPQRKTEFLKCTSLKQRLIMLKELLPLPS